MGKSNTEVMIYSMYCALQLGYPSIHHLAYTNPSLEFYGYLEPMRMDKHCIDAWTTKILFPHIFMHIYEE